MAFFKFKSLGVKTAGFIPAGFSGQITVMLSMTLTILLSLVLTVLTGARVQTMRLMAEITTDMGLDSCYAEYHRQLLSQYGLLFIDDSYGGKNPSIENVSKHLREYLGGNLDMSDIIALGRLWNPASLKADSVMIGDASIATDNFGEVFKRQAIDCVKDKYGLAYLELIKDQSQTVSDSDYENSDLGNKAAANSRKAQQLVDEENARRKSAHDAAVADYERKKAEYDPEEGGEAPTAPAAPQYVSIDNQANRVDTSNSVLLSTILSSQSDLSTVAYDLNTCASNRTLYSGAGLREGRAAPDSVLDEVAFGEYIMDKYGNYTKQSDEDCLKYQVEYIIAGKDSDRGNLEGVAARILAIRGGANLVTLLSSKSKIAQVEAAAAAACAAFEAAQPFVKAALIFAWAYAESALDLNILLSGRSVSLVKSDSEWQLSFADMFHYKDFFGVKKGNDSGLKYGAYLRMLLVLTGKDKKTMRAIDVIEMDMRKTKGNLYFRMDACMDYFVASIEYKSPLGYRFEIVRGYSYE